MKKRVIDTTLKNKCKSCNPEALRESLGIMIHNSLCNVAYGKEEDYKWNQGYLKALEDVSNLINNQ